VSHRSTSIWSTAVLRQLKYALVCGFENIAFISAQHWERAHVLHAAEVPEGSQLYCGVQVPPPPPPPLLLPHALEQLSCAQP
jgi:hypothetical protein